MAQEKGVIGMQECLQYIRDNREESEFDITTCLYADTLYNKKTLELQVKVHVKNTTKYFHVTWNNPRGDDDEDSYPLKVNAPENDSKDLYELFMSIEEDISPDTTETLMWLFDFICEKERHLFALRKSKDNGLRYITKLEDKKEIEANVDGVLPFDYVERYNEIDNHLEELTMYPPEELKTVEEMVGRLREINDEKTIIIDIDYNNDATYVVVQAEGNKSFMVSASLMPNAEFDDEELSVATYFLMGMFMQAVKDKEAFPDVSDVEVRQVARMLLEFQSNSAAEEVASSTKKTTTTTTVVSTPSTATSSFRPAVYTGVPADSSSGNTKPATTELAGSTLSNAAGAAGDDKDPFPDYQGADYTRTGLDAFDEQYAYD